MRCLLQIRMKYESNTVCGALIDSVNYGRYRWHSLFYVHLSFIPPFVPSLPFFCCICFHPLCASLCLCPVTLSLPSLLRPISPPFSMFLPLNNCLPHWLIVHSFISTHPVLLITALQISIPTCHTYSLCLAPSLFYCCVASRLCR